MLHIKCMRNYCALAGIQHSSFVIINFVSRILHRKLTDTKMEDAAGQLLGAAVDRHCPTLGYVISTLTYVAVFIAFILGNACFISSTICLVKGEILYLSYVLAMVGNMMLLICPIMHFGSKWQRNLERKKRNLENQNKETNIPDHEGVYVELE